MPEPFDRNQLQALLDRITATAPRHFGGGEVADYIPALAEVDPDQFGIAVCDVDGQVWQAGSSQVPFSIQSISKVLNLVIAMQRLEEKDIWTRVGREPSGHAFNSMAQLEEEKGIPRNPFINAGAVLVAELLVSRVMSIHVMVRENARRLAGNPAIQVDDRVARSEMEHKARNAALAYLMKAYDNFHSEVNDVLDLYCHGCALAMSCVDVARAFAFLAHGGVNPQSGLAVVTPQQTRQLNALLLTCGLYDAAGDFAWRVGLPGKSGVGGGIVAIVPGQMSICVWSPRLDSYGNSVAGLRALEALVEGLGVAPLG